MRLYKIIASVFFAAILLSVSFTAFAASNSPSVDMEKEGSITLTLFSDENKTAPQDGELTIYKVADLGYDENGNMVYTYTSDFAASTVSLNNLDDASLPTELENIATSLNGTSKSIDNNGYVKFSSLSLGLYLIVQSDNSTGYYPIDSFLVTVPIAENNEWIYDVDASPKVEVKPEVTTEETTGKTTETTTAVEETTVKELTTANNQQSKSTHSTASASTTSVSKLPQTGQLVWPIPVLVICGLLLVALGWILITSRKKKDHEA